MSLKIFAELQEEYKSMADELNNLDSFKNKLSITIQKSKSEVKE